MRHYNNIHFEVHDMTDNSVIRAFDSSDVFEYAHTIVVAILEFIHSMPEIEEYFFADDFEFIEDAGCVYIDVDSIDDLYE